MNTATNVQTGSLGRVKDPVGLSDLLDLVAEEEGRLTRSLLSLDSSIGWDETSEAIRDLVAQVRQTTEKMRSAIR